MLDGHPTAERLHTAEEWCGCGAGRGAGRAHVFWDCAGAGGAVVEALEGELTGVWALPEGGHYNENINTMRISIHSGRRPGLVIPQQQPTHRAFIQIDAKHGSLSAPADLAASTRTLLALPDTALVTVVNYDFHSARLLIAASSPIAAAAAKIDRSGDDPALGNYRFTLIQHPNSCFHTGFALVGMNYPMLTEITARHILTALNAETPFCTSIDEIRRAPRGDDFMVKIKTLPDDCNGSKLLALSGTPLTLARPPRRTTAPRPSRPPSSRSPTPTRSASSTRSSARAPRPTRPSTR